MGSLKFVTSLAVLSLGFIPLVMQPANAAPPVAGIVGSAPSSVANCPNINWRLARHDDGNITGIMFFSDLSGTSEVKGTVTKAGVFHIDAKSVMGNGPNGAVDGKTEGLYGGFVATMKGAGCANFHESHMISVNDLNLMPQS